MAISRRTFIRQTATLGLAVLTGCSLFSERNKPLYITEPDKNAITDILKAFEADFPSKNGSAGLNYLIDNAKQRHESVVVKKFDGCKSYQILRPLEFQAVNSGLNYKASLVREDGHGISVYFLGIKPASECGYYGSVSLDDPAGDLGSFLLAVDGKVHREGIFIKPGTMDMLEALMARMEIEVAGVTVEADKMPIECSVDEEGKFLGCHVATGVRYFGNIPVGKHELMFYAMDNRGNRSFACVNYNIGFAPVGGTLDT